MDSIQVALDRAVRDAVRVLSVAQAPDRPLTAVGARRVIFGLFVISEAQRQGRLPSSVRLAEALDAVRLPSSPSMPPIDESILAQVMALVTSVPRSVTTEMVVVSYERALKWLPANGPSTVPATDPEVQHNAGAYYTPPDIVEGVLDMALAPALSMAVLAGGDAIRALKVCDPACGPGIFLLASLRRMARELATVSRLPQADAASEVLRTCLYGVDLDLAAVELCRGILWLETSLSWEQLATLQTFRCANSLLGAHPEVAQAMVQHQASLFASPQHLSSPETDWCRTYVEEPTEGFLHWHLAFPEVFVTERGARDRHTGCPGGFDVVVGNPPFLNQLEEDSAHDRNVRELLRARFGGAAKGYADAAVTFTLLGVDLVREGGCCTLIAPLSILAARDAEAARRRWAETAALESLWVATEHVFEGAAVYVCAPALRKGTDVRDQVNRRRDRVFAPLAPCEVAMGELATWPTWSPLIADVMGIPDVRVTTRRAFGDEAIVTADFREQYYGLRGFIREDADVPPEDHPDFPRLLTTGLVDLAHCLWGTQPTRFDGQRWLAPRVDLRALIAGGNLGPWAQSRLIPKVVLATQTKVLETLVDEQGIYLPSIPLISVVPSQSEMLWHLASALASPPLAALAATRYLGSALAIDAIKLSAAQVRDLPLPPVGSSWDAAARAFRSAQAEPRERERHLVESARLMCLAYELDQEATDKVMAWWTPRAQGKDGLRRPAGAALRKDTARPSRGRRT